MTDTETLAILFIEEEFALSGPAVGDAATEFFQRQTDRLAVLPYRLYDVRCEVTSAVSGLAVIGRRGASCRDFRVLPEPVRTSGGLLQNLILRELVDHPRRLFMVFDIPQRKARTVNDGIRPARNAQREVVVSRVRILRAADEYSQCEEYAKERAPYFSADEHDTSPGSYTYCNGDMDIYRLPECQNIKKKRFCLPLTRGLPQPTHIRTNRTASGSATGMRFPDYVVVPGNA